MDIQKDIQELQAIASEHGLQLKGRIQVFVKRANTGIEELLVDKENTIATNLKTNMRDTMNSNVDFALDNLQATQVANASLGASQNAKDGIVTGNGNPSTEAYKPGDATAPDFMASAVHPTTPSGSSPFFRQWQGVYQNLLAGAETLSGAILGQNYLNTDNGAFVLQYALGTFASVVLAQNDILTINWKITVG